jgi:hypothetical protein
MTFLSFHNQPFLGWGVGVSFALWSAWITIKLKKTMKEMNQQVELTAR